ncbi:MAG: FtsX-like permease family protein, partial [Gammaproteobacteria bacterium]
SSQPSHINLILRNVADRAVLQRVQALDGVGGLDTMTPLTERFKLPNESEWRMGTLILRAAPPAQSFDITRLQSGRWPKAGEIALENLSAEWTGLKAGDRIEFETSQGIKSLPVSGIVRHAFVKPPNFGGQLHFFADPASAPLFGIADDTFRQLLVQIAPPYSFDKTRAIASKIRTELNNGEIGVNATLLQNPEKHWGRPFFAGVNGVLKIMALASLILASVLIMNTMSAHIQQQTDQIGVMKALGARRLTIFKVYLAEVVLMALAAIMLAAPLSLASAYLGSCKILALFNIDCGTFDYSPRAVEIMLLGGILAPLAAASRPILHGASMTVRIAIASYGLGVDFGYSRFDRWLERIGARLLSTLDAAALGNMFRRKGRLLLTQSVLICAGTMFLVLMSLIASVNLTLDNEMARSRFDVRLGFSADQSERRVRDLAASEAKTRQAEVWQRLPMDMSRNGEALRQKGSLGAQLLAVPAATSMYRPLIEHGRWLQAADAGQRVLVLSAETAALNGIEVGDVLQVRLGSVRLDWQVVGLYRWLAGSNYAVEPVYAPQETVRDITRNADTASFLVLDAAIANADEEAAYVRAIKRIFGDGGIRLDVYNTVAKLEQRRYARNQFNPVIATLLGLAAMIAAVGGVGLSGALAIGVLQRTREIGVLRAIGARSQAIFRLFLLEGFLHGIVAWAFSVPLAYAAAKPISRELGQTMLGIQLDFAFDFWAVGYWLGLVLALAAAASFWPARKAARLTVRESLGH